MDVSTIAAEFSFKSSFAALHWLTSDYVLGFSELFFVCVSYTFSSFSIIIFRDSIIHCSKSNQQSCIDGYLS